MLYKKNKKAYNSFIIYLIKEGKKTENKDKKNITRKRIINYVLNNHVTSKAGIAKELNLSMPTVLANVNDLLEKGVLEETGEYASTGGRKAKSIGINNKGKSKLIPEICGVLAVIRVMYPCYRSRIAYSLSYRAA